MIMWFKNSSKKDNHNVINVSNQNDVQSLILAELIKLNKTLGKVIGQTIEHEKRITKLEERGGRGK